MAITKDGLFKYQALNERQRKNLMILEMIRKKGPVSKSEMSKQLGYNIVTLSNYVEEYINKGIVRHDGLESSSGGRKPQLVELSQKEMFILGVDFSRESVRGVLADIQMNIVARAQFQRPAIEQEQVSAALISVIGDVIKKSGVEASKIKFIAIGVYGVIESKNGAIKGLDEEEGRLRATVYFTELKKAIEKQFNINTFFGTDVTFAAFGERAKNPSAEVDNMLYIFQDIGKGAIIKGELYCGTDIGSSDMEGVTGALSDEERYKISEHSVYLRPWDSKMSLKKEAFKIIESGVGTKIVEMLKGSIGDLKDEVIVKAAEADDEIALELIEGIGINLGVRISYLINLFSPQVVLIGGGIEKAKDLLFKHIRNTIEKLSLEKPAGAVKVLPAVLGDEAVTLGAVSVGIREVFLEA